jgi:very-short-patch-repair endonuclease
MKKRLSELEERLNLHFKAARIDAVREYRFAALHVGQGKGLRKRLANCNLQDWRFDFAIPEKKIAIECEGGTWTGGGHTRGKKYENDCKKYNEATILGWRVLRFTTDQVKRGEALETTRRLIGALN